MPAIFIACYPRPADGKYRFDLDYYLNVHMPMQLHHHGPYGMRSWHVIQPTAESPYVIQTIEHWDSLEGIERAISESSKELYADLPKYTDIQNAFPIKGEIKGSYIDPTIEGKWTERKT